MADKYIYIDESGDPGLKSSSSGRFIVAAVVVIGEEERNKLSEALDNYKKGLGWKEYEELKFHKTHKDAIRLAIKTANKFEYEAYVMILDKANATLPKFSNVDGSVMAYIIKELLQKLALSNADIIIDGSYGPRFIKKARPYFRKNSIGSEAAKCHIRFVDSKSSSLIQLADLVAGAVARSFTSKADANTYLELLGKKIKKFYKI